jgi:hypothetical protein
VKQHLAEDDVGRVHHAHVQRRQALAVLVVRTRAQLQKGPGNQNNVLFVLIFCDINVIKFFLILSYIYVLVFNRFFEKIFICRNM